MYVKSLSQTKTKIVKSRKILIYKRIVNLTISQSNSGHSKVYSNF